METKELLRELVKESLNDDFIKFQIKEKVDELFDYNIREEIRSVANRFVKDKADGYIREVVLETLNNKVKIDNGWGERAEYETFEDFVRQSIAKELKKSWNIESKIRNAVWDKLKVYVEQVVDEKTEDRVDSVLELLAEDIKTEQEPEIRDGFSF